jgi:hypothetical protein
MQFEIGLCFDRMLTPGRFTARVADPGICGNVDLFGNESDQGRWQRLPIRDTSPHMTHKAKLDCQTQLIMSHRLCAHKVQVHLAEGIVQNKCLFVTGDTEKDIPFSRFKQRSLRHGFSVTGMG